MHEDYGIWDFLTQLNPPSDRVIALVTWINTPALQQTAADF